MCELVMSLPDDSVAVLADSPEEAFTRMRMLSAVKLFEMKEISSESAAELAGISRLEFLKRLADYGVPVFDMSEDDLAKETRLA